MNKKGKPDLAHAPGHRKINVSGALDSDVKLQQKDSEAQRRFPKEDVISRNESPQRKNIPGASIEKKGRRV